MYQAYEIAIPERERRLRKSRDQLEKYSHSGPPSVETLTDLSRESVNKWRAVGIARALAEAIKSAEREKFRKEQADIPQRSMLTFEDDVSEYGGTFVFFGDAKTSSDDMRLRLNKHTRNLAELKHKASEEDKTLGKLNYCYTYSATKQSGVVLKRDPKKQQWDWFAAYEPTPYHVWKLFAVKATEKFSSMAIAPTVNTSKLVRADFVT
ncbi:MAG: hypothetical protein Harvfovirus22_23 [Harvfovirus sp.]|uniref:Uncharacterized protein n=1 Tax=Harvfovirus sp. TaxID=2487768 RepID=A0A3G5A1Z5_9VIRU|nr:MAG: hypothetical protein Harvfovirus22_23 [Harvfovirus sp.]